MELTFEEPLPNIYEVLEELHRNKALEPLSDKIVVNILKDFEHIRMYFEKYREYQFLLDIRKSFFSDYFLASNKSSNKKFIEDCYDGEEDSVKSVALKGTTKTVLTLLYKSLPSEIYEAKDSLKNFLSEVSSLSNSGNDFFEGYEIDVASKDVEKILHFCKYFKRYEERQIGKRSGYANYKNVLLGDKELDQCLYYFTEYISYHFQNRCFKVEYKDLFEEILHQDNTIHKLNIFLANFLNTSNSQYLLAIQFMTANIRTHLKPTGNHQVQNISTYKNKKKPLLNSDTKYSYAQLLHEIKQTKELLDMELLPLLDIDWIKVKLFDYFITYKKPSSY